ncbi:hypothetical protein ACE1ET_08130 [Saccharicrinis sp. FJH62]|uniref:hypothetical protein n=1 Tax=Saccharicrinis sp. FJH62 TaxID=3344657 RepID=UPI0035D4F4EB
MVNRLLTGILFMLCVLPESEAQYKYYIPTDYNGIFYGQPTSTRATAMGLTTITQGGVENVVYNPASLGVIQNRTELYYSYAKGNQVRIGSSNRFEGLAYRINDKIVAGFSRMRYVEKNSPWTTIIGWYEDSQEKRTQAMYTLSGSYSPYENLQVGASGNWLIGKSVTDVTTNKVFIISVGSIYDMETDWIRHEQLSNQRIRFALSFVNLLMKNRIEERYQDYLHYRDMPIHLTLGSSYNGTLPFNYSFLKGFTDFFNDMPETVDLSFHVQIRETLRGPKKTVVNGNYESNTSIGLGAEALFMDFFVFRLGYFYETRPDQGPAEGGGYWMTDDKRGMTFGYGFKVPVYELTKQKVPVNADIDFVTFRVLNELGTTTTVPAIFSKNNFLFSFGVKLTWVNKPTADLLSAP